MRFYELITEKYNITKEISLQDIDFSKCKIAIDQYKKGNIIYRGMPNDSSILFGDSSKHIRKSANTFNYYTEIIDHSPLWKDYPKRSKSFICSTSKTIAQQYDDVFIVLPFDNPVIGVCPTDDIWDSFKGFTLQDFNYAVEGLMDYFIGKNKDTYENILLLCDTLDNYDLDDEDYQELKQNFGDLFKIYDYITKEKKAIKGFQNLLSPTRNNFILTNLNSMSEIKLREIWFSGPAYFISINSVSDVIKSAF